MVIVEGRIQFTDNVSPHPERGISHLAKHKGIENDSGSQVVHFLMSSAQSQNSVSSEIQDQQYYNLKQRLGEDVPPHDVGDQGLTAESKHDIKSTVQEKPMEENSFNLGNEFSELHYYHSKPEINGRTYVRPTGVLSIRSSVGGSVASASAPRVSMIKFTQSSCKQNMRKISIPIWRMRSSIEFSIPDTEEVL